MIKRPEENERGRKNGKVGLNVQGQLGCGPRCRLKGWATEGGGRFREGDPLRFETDVFQEGDQVPLEVLEFCRFGGLKVQTLKCVAYGEARETCLALRNLGPSDDSAKRGGGDGTLHPLDGDIETASIVGSLSSSTEFHFQEVLNVVALLSFFSLLLFLKKSCKSNKKL
ncbi:MAG: hypothetical protein KBD27_00090 [Candidatus Moranbacteria bacterium]|nr:hypothetical protein [Candidatus Moranbacteria bacterium]